MNVPFSRPGVFLLAFIGAALLFSSQPVLAHDGEDVEMTVQYDSLDRTVLRYEISDFDSRTIDIDHEKCKTPRECRKCMEVCPEDVLWNKPTVPREPGKKADNYIIVPGLKVLCTGCKLCEEVCPQGAKKVTVNRRSYE